MRNEGSRKVLRKTLSLGGLRRNGEHGASGMEAVASTTRIPNFHCPVKDSEESPRADFVSNAREDLVVIKYPIFRPLRQRRPSRSSIAQ